MLNKKSYQFRIWKFYNIYVLIGFYSSYLAYLLVCRTPQLIAAQNYFFAVMLLMWNMGGFSQFITQGPYYLVPDQVASLVNITENLITTLEQKHFHNPAAFSKSRRLRKIFMELLGAYSFGSLIPCLPVIYMLHGSFFNLGGVFCYILQYCFGSLPNLLIFLLTWIIDIHWILLMWGGSIFAIHINLLFMHTFKYSVQNIFRIWPTKGMSHFFLRKTFIIYNSLRMTCLLFNQVFGKLFAAPFKTIAGLCMIIAVMITVRLSENLLVFAFGAFLLVVTFSVTVIYTQFMAMVNDFSVKLGKRLRREKTLSPEGRRLVRSFKVEAVKSGSFYDVRRVTCLNFLGMIGNMTGSALIYTKG